MTNLRDTIRLEQENKQLKEELNRIQILNVEANTEIYKNKEIVQKVKECLDNINLSEIDSMTVDIINELKEILGDREGAKEYNDI